MDQVLATQAQAVTVVNASPILTIVVPTLNERDNVEPLIALLDAALRDISWEVMFCLLYTSPSPRDS